MRKFTERKQVFSRRVFILGGVKLAAATALLGRLYYLQFLRSETYQTLAEDNRINLQLIAPPRGKLLDRNGVPMAENNVYYRSLLERTSLKDSQTTLKEMAQLLALPEEEYTRLEGELKRLWKGHALTVKERLEWDELVKLEFNAPSLPGMYIESGQIRTYPLAGEAAHLIGYVGAAAENEIEPNQPVLKLPGFKIGKSGVEKYLEPRLRGKAGLRHLEMNAAGLVVREVKRQEPESGEDIRLTIDSRLQRFAAERLRGQSGAIIVMEVESGRVLALASEPAFDPNRFSEGIKKGYWRELNDDIKNPMLNKAISGQYPPGSTFKMLVGLAALEQGLITPSSTVYCPGHFFLGNHQFNCWKPEGHGTMNVVTAIAQSCDTFFYTMSHRLGIQPIADMARRFGLGQELGLGIPNEKPGIVPDPDWKRKSYGVPWQGGDTVNVGIGQGYILATPLQLCVMAARIANGKNAVVPRVIPEDVTPALLQVDPAHLDVIRHGMNVVVNAPYGTAYGSRLPVEGFAMAGKTGTSQVRKIVVRGQDQSTIPWEHRHHALFVAYAPADKPKYALSILIEHGGGGASAAAPVARDVMLKLHEIEQQDKGAL